MSDPVSHPESPAPSQQDPSRRRFLKGGAALGAALVAGAGLPLAGRAQPYDNPGSLTPDQVYAVTAYLLHRNGIIGEQDVMDAQTLPQVKMPNRDGFVPDPRPDVGPAAK
jgi:anaerobic selenocysteine-containing dehydrogenase